MAKNWTCRLFGHRWTVWMRWGVTAEKRSCWRCGLIEDRSYAAAPAQEQDAVDPVAANQHEPTTRD